MPPQVIDTRRAEDRRDVIHRAVQALAEGELVAFPTETVYGLAASARAAAGVERLAEVKGRPKAQPFTLAIKSGEEALDYVPNLSPLARRLARRCWPGPVTLVVDDNDDDGLVRRLPESVQQQVTLEGSLGLRVPAHALILDVLRMLAGPLALTSANRTGEPDAVNVDAVIDSLGDDVQIVLDDGPCRYGQPSSVVRVRGNELEVLRPGVVAEPTLRRLSSYLLLLVCTGNTCRSPMAEQWGRHLIAERLGCTVDELEDRGVIVLSAGISAGAGARASAEAVEIMEQAGLDLTQHASQPLTAQLVLHADLVLTMTASHRASIVAQWPDAASRTIVLRRDGADVCDPIGGPIDVYRSCSEQIREALALRVAELELP